MQGGMARSVCFLAFLFCLSQAKQDLSSSEDLKTVASHSISVDEESKSGAVAESSAYTDGGYSQSESHAESSGGSSVASSQANAITGLDGIPPDAIRQGASAVAKAEALAQSNRGLLGQYEGVYPYQPGNQMNLPPYGSDSSVQSQAQALASANTGGGGGYYNPVSPYQTGYSPMPPYNSGPSSAIAQAEAQALASKRGIGYYSPGLTSYQPVYQPNPYTLGSNSAQAQAEAQSISNSGSGYSPGVRPYTSGYNSISPYGPEISSAQAQAQAVANNGGNGPYSPGLSPYQPGYQPFSPYSQGSSSAHAQAEAVANNGGGSYGSNWNPYQDGNQYPMYVNNPAISSQAQAHANVEGSGSYNMQNPYHTGYPYISNGGSSQAQAEALASTNVPSGQGLNPYQPGNQYQTPPYSPGYPGSAGASAQAQAISNGATADINGKFTDAHSSAIAVTDAYARVIPLDSYVRPHLIPDDGIIARQATEMTCKGYSGEEYRVENTIVCSKEGELYNLWSSVHQCLVCACINELGYLRPVCASCSGCMVPDPIPLPPPPPPSPPKPDSQVSCPLPSGEPFQNPLNPCEICVCTEFVNIYGVPDVMINCQENPACAPVPQPIDIPPPVPEPINFPHPPCDSYPVDDFAPDPQDPCKLCKCVPNPQELDIFGYKIVCIPNPACVPLREPITEPPLPVPIPIEPVPFPDIVPSDPYPWQPLPTPTPPAPGPLPGPPPHESCKPYTPNQLFQHPWDECQNCVCTESYAVGRITIEINCYTKKSCCYEYPYENAVTVTAVPYVPTTPALQVVDKICEFKTFGVEFVHPQDACRVCTCDVRGGLIQPACVRADRPDCAPVYSPGGGSSSAEAYASANAQTTSSPQTSALAPFKGRPSTYNPYAPNQSVTSAEASSLTQSSNQSPFQQGLPAQVPKLRNKQLADTSYLGQYQKPSIISPLSTYSQYQPGYYQGNLMYPISNSPYTDSYAQADAIANALSSYNQYLPYYTGGNINYPDFLSGDVLSAYNQYQPYYSGGNTNYLDGSSSALANAEALANAFSGYNGYSSPYYPGSSMNYPGSSLSSADALANAQTGFSPTNPYLSSIPASSMYPNLYPRQSDEITPLYQPGGANFDGSEGSALAHAIAQTHGSNAHSQASAHAGGGGFRTKSAEDDVSDEVLGEVSAQCQKRGLTPQYLQNVKSLKHVAAFKDAAHRGPSWYDYSDTDRAETAEHSDMQSSVTDTSSEESSHSISASSSSAASSVETKERRLAKRVYRTCTPCPQDMLKSHKNKGIKWICGAYQRARRTFKSECMMRYRNCQDGTLFVKIYDHRCKNDTYHGRHWFYVYRV